MLRINTLSSLTSSSPYFRTFPRVLTVLITDILLEGAGGIICVTVPRHSFLSFAPELMNE